MNDDEIFNKILKIVSKFAARKEALATANFETRITEDLAIDSARIVDITLDLEEEFGIEIDDKITMTMKKLGDVVKIIRQRKKPD